MPTTEKWSDQDLAKIGHLKQAHDVIVAEIRKAVVGQERVVKELMIALFAQGHCLLMGVPGLAKTLLVRTLASSLSLRFKRVQFTPDLMPSDITRRRKVIEENKQTGERIFRFIPGPIFTNILLADEINPHPTQTQAALLEAMQERQVTAGGERSTGPALLRARHAEPHRAGGHVPAAEAQLDRFMMLINVGYPTEDEEMRCLDLTTAGYTADVKPVLAGPQILELQQLVRRVNISEAVMRTIVAHGAQDARGARRAPDVVKKWVSWGRASPRACQSLVLGPRPTPSWTGATRCDDGRRAGGGQPVLNIASLVNFVARSEGVTSVNVIDELVKQAV